MGPDFCLAPAGANDEAVTGRPAAAQQTSVHLASGLTSVHTLVLHGVPPSSCFLSVPTVLQPAKGVCLLQAGPQEWDAQFVI